MTNITANDYDLFQGAIIIHEVYEEGAAAKDSRLWAGDQILEVCWFGK